jgi:hypothetical protein
VLLLCSRGGDAMMARIDVLKALHRNVVREFRSDRKRDALGQTETEAGRTTRARARSNPEISLDCEAVHNCMSERLLTFQRSGFEGPSNRRRRDTHFEPDAAILAPRETILSASRSDPETN